MNIRLWLQRRTEARKTESLRWALFDRILTIFRGGAYDVPRLPERTIETARARARRAFRVLHEQLATARAALIELLAPTPAIPQRMPCNCGAQTLGDYRLHDLTCSIGRPL